MSQLPDVDLTPIERPEASFAPVAAVRSQLADARAMGDWAAEPRLSARLSRLLVRRGTRLDEATKVARRSLLFAEDPALREELSAWFAGLGEPWIAAATLRPLALSASGPEAAKLWIRVAVLAARSRGDDQKRGQGAAERMAAAALLAASDADPYSSLALELLAAMSAWSSAVTRRQASRAYLEAASRRRGAGRNNAASDHNLLRALEADPSNTRAAEQLAERLAQDGRFEAADEVWRHCAASTDTPEEVHARRLREALGAGSVALALAAAIDAQADRSLSASSLETAVGLMLRGAGAAPVPGFDGLLAAAGLRHLLVARLELVAARETGANRLRMSKQLAEICEGPLNQPLRAFEVTLHAAMMDPCEATCAPLRELAARSGDLRPLQCALLRWVNTSPSAMAPCLELAEVAFESTGQQDLARWALQRAKECEPLPETHRKLEQQLGSVVRAPLPFRPPAALDVTELEAQMRRLEALPNEGEALAETAAAWLEQSILRERELSAKEVFLLVNQLVARGMNEKAHDLLERCEDVAALRPRLFNHYLRTGNLAACVRLQKTSSSLSEDEVAMFAAVCSAHGSPSQRLHGLSLLATHAPEDVRGQLLSIASEGFLQLGQLSSAEDLGRQAARVAPRSPRALAACAFASASETLGTRRLALARALEASFARGAWCVTLAHWANADQDEEAEYGWLARATALAPLGDATSQLFAFFERRPEDERLMEAIDWFVALPQPSARLTRVVLAPLERAVVVSERGGLPRLRRFLGTVGAQDRALFERVIGLSRTIANPLLEAAVRERGTKLATDGPDSFLQLAASYRQAELHDAAWDSLLRALCCGAETESVAAHMAELPSASAGDGVLAELQVRARVFEGSEATQAEAAHIYRKLGAAWVVFADSAEHALGAWEQSQRLQGDGWSQCVVDAYHHLSEAVASRSIVAQARRMASHSGADLCVAAAAYALKHRRTERALQLAQEALSLNPGATSSLTVFEATVGEVSLAQTRAAYETVEGAVLGRYGEWALNSRAARHFAELGETDLAHTHAKRAFAALPNEAGAFSLLRRTAVAAGVADQLLSVVEESLEGLGTSERKIWLDRCLAVSGDGAEGLEQRATSLLGELGRRAEPLSAIALGTALKELMAQDPEAPGRLRSAFGATSRALLARVGGESGALLAMSLAEVAATGFRDASHCAQALIHAVKHDPGGAIYGPVGDWVPLLALKPGSAWAVLDAVADASSVFKVDRELLKATERLAAQASPEHVPRLVVARATLSPEDSELQARARTLSASDPSLLFQIQEGQEQERKLEQRASDSLQSSSEEAALSLRAMLDEPQIGDDLFRRVFRNLRERLEASGSESLGDLLGFGASREQLSAEDRAACSRAHAKWLAVRHKWHDALDALGALDRDGVLQLGDVESACDWAKEGGDQERELQYELRRDNMMPSDVPRTSCLRRIAHLASELGQAARAAEFYEKLLVANPENEQARNFVVEFEQQQGNWERVVQFLQNGLRFSANSDERDQKLSRMAGIVSRELADPERAVALLQEAREGKAAERSFLLEAEAMIMIELKRPADAGVLLERAGRAAQDSERAAELAERAARHLMDADQWQSAASLLADRGLLPSTEAIAKLRVSAERRRGDAAGLASALKELASVGLGDAAERVGCLLEAASVMLKAEDLQAAVQYAKQAAHIAPTHAVTQLAARTLEYKLRRAGTEEDAQRTIAELSELTPIETAEQAILQAFLIAEARRVRGGPEAGLSELEAVAKDWGSRSLLKVALAERFVELEQQERAREELKGVTDSELRGFRTPKELSALRAAAQSPGTAGTRAAFKQTLVSRGVPLVSSERQPEIEVVEVAAPQAAQIAALSRTRAGNGGNLPSVSAPGSDVFLEDDAPSDEKLAPATMSRATLMYPESRPSVRFATSEEGERVADESAELRSRLKRGDTDAGVLLLEQLAPTRENARARVDICSELVLRCPWRKDFVAQLRDCVVGDGNKVHGRALDHVLAIWDGAESIAPPALSTEAVQSERLLAVLRGPRTPAMEVLSTVWKCVPRLFRSGDAVPEGAVDVASMGGDDLQLLTRTASIVLGVPRTRVMLCKEGELTRLFTLLTDPVTLVIEGAAPANELQFQFHLGAMMAAALPAHVLVYGLTPERLRVVLAAALASFGPPRRLKGDVPAIAQLAERLWESLPTAVQRRMQELCEDPANLDEDRVLIEANRVMWRAGLFVCGDLATALSEVCQLQRLDFPEDWSALEKLAVSSPGIADLLRFATSSEFAEARWR